MDNPFNKLRLKSAAPDSTYFNLSSNHLTTCNFSQLRPSYYREMYIGDKFKIKMDLTAFTAPLVVPPMGIAHLKSRAFFVPYRLVWKHFNDFYNRKKVNKGNTLYSPLLPMFTNSDFINAFRTFSSSSGGRDNIKLLTLVEDSEALADIYFKTNVTFKYNFTPFGRQVFAFLRSLGYSFTWANDVITEYSALPILCVMKAYLDYYVPASFIQTHPINGFLTEIYDSVGDGVTNTVDCNTLLDCITRMYISYPDNYFTSAWQSPTAPYGGESLNGNTSNMTGPFAFNPDGQTIFNDGATVALPANGVTSQYALNVLRAFDSWFKRNNFAGAARVSDALLAKFGIRPSDESLQRAQFVGYDDVPIKWQMITNVSSSDGAELGAFGAKGYAEGNGKTFTYEAREIGFFVILSSLQADAIYYHGTDKQNMQITPFEFYQAEFEKVGMSPVKVAEIYNDCTFSPLQETGVLTYTEFQNKQLDPNRIYGYVPNYAHCKVPRDIISGDFVIPSLGQELSSWHFGREFKFDPNNQGEPYDNFVLSPLNVRFQPIIGSQFNRIFNVTDDSADHFILVYSFEVDAWRPMLSISDSLQIDGNGEEVEVQPDGTHLD